jgi:hypothetical protein
MRRQHWLVALACFAGTAWSAAPPAPNQFAQGIDVMPQSTKPVVQVTLPDEVYRTVDRSDLGDIAVFDATGAIVPHALCAAPEHQAPTITVVELPVIELRAADTAPGSGGTKVDVTTSAGTHVAVDDRVATHKLVSTRAHVIDATDAEQSIRSIEFDWQTADGSSEARVRIDVSDDLDQWRTVVASTRLVQAAAGGRELRRERVSLPHDRYRYLRVERIDQGTPIIIRAVRAETVSATQRIEPLWFAPAQTDASTVTRTFTSDRRAPVEYARLTLPLDNMTVRATLQSRRDDRSAWTTRWSGEMYAIVSDGVRKTSDPARFTATSDREWRLQLAGNPAKVGLELGYRPALLRFVAQGEHPFTIAYGSKQIEPTSLRGCNQLLGDLETNALQALIGDAALSSPRVLGGDEAFKPLPKRTPVRLIVLWCVLIVGVTLLVVMALKLLQRVRGAESDTPADQP